jgi:hypothetical protein
MIKISIEDLSKREALDKEDMGRIRGGHSFCGTPPGSLPDIEKMLAKFMKAFPEAPIPVEPYGPPVGGPAVDVPSELDQTGVVPL